MSGIVLDSVFDLLCYCIFIVFFCFLNIVFLVFIWFDLECEGYSLRGYR